jgi:hypothetical protein
MPDYDSGFDAVRRSDRIVDALSAGRRVPSSDPGDLAVASLLAHWRDDVRRQPVPQLVSTRQAAAAIRPGRPPRRARFATTVSGAVAAALLCLGGFGALIYDAHPGDALYGVRTTLFGESPEVRDARVELAAQTQLTEVQQLIAQGQWQQAQDKLTAASTTVADVNDAQSKQALTAEMQRLSVQVQQRNPDATVPPSTSSESPLSESPSPGSPPGLPSPESPSPGLPMPGSPSPGLPMPGSPSPGLPMPGSPPSGAPPSDGIPGPFGVPGAPPTETTSPAAPVTPTTATPAAPTTTPAAPTTTPAAPTPTSESSPTPPTTPTHTTTLPTTARATTTEPPAPLVPTTGAVGGAGGSTGADGSRGDGNEPGGQTPPPVQTSPATTPPRIVAPHNPQESPRGHFGVPATPGFGPGG